jgi:pimeloyl-ACP methyl ester carboxylesterase
VRAPTERAAWRAPLSPVTSTDHVELAIHDLGPGPAENPADDDGWRRPILLAHATGFHGRVWQPLATHLRGYHAIAPDLRGHGDSPPPTGRDQDWAGFADDILAVVDAWGVEDLVAVGHSKGGAALLLAEQRRPGTFAALWLYEPVVFPTEIEGVPVSRPGSDNPLAEGARRRRAVFASRQAAYDNYAAKPPLSSLDPAALHAYVDHGFADQPDGTVRLKCSPEVEAATFAMAADSGAFDGLGDVRCPVVVARGALSEFGPAAFAGPVAQALPFGRLEAFDQLSHFGPLEQPALVAARIAADLSSRS